MIELEFNDAQMTAVLARLSAAMSDMTPAMQDLGELLVASTQDRMEAGLQPDGAAFAPRSQTTLERYEKLGLSFGAPLNQSGDMRLGIFYEPGDDSVRWGSNAIQSAVMQFGAAQGEFGAHIGKDSLGRDHFHSIPWGNIPARPFLGISDEDELNIIAELEDWIETSAGE